MSAIVADDRTIAHCVIDELKQGSSGPGFYYSLRDAEGNETDPIGPFETAQEAEESFMAAMEAAAVEMIKKSLGLEN